MTHLRLMMSFEKEPLTALFLRLLTAAMLFLSMPRLGQADTIKIGGTGAALGTMQLLGKAFRKTHSDATVVIVPGLGSSGGRKALHGGVIDIAVTSRAGRSVEKPEGVLAVLYGRSPFVFATSKKNPISGLTTKDIVEIWSGKKTTWPDGTRVRLILRPETDSDTEVLEGISPAMDEAVKLALSRPGMKIAITDSDSADAIQSTPGALGTSLLSLIIAEKRALKVLLLDGVEPSPKTISGGSYRYFKSLYILTRAKPSELAQQFVAFLSAARGHEILGQLGHWVVEDKTGQ
jgi:phosphate transport system substrate-binding protein